MDWSIERVRAEEKRQAFGVAELSDISEPIAGGAMCFAGPGAWANQAAGLGMHGAVGEEELDRLVAFYTSRGVAPRIEVSSYADESLVSGLARRGFVLTEFENVFWRSLEGCSETWSPGHVLSGLTLTRVPAQDPGAVETFVEVTTRAFEDGGDPFPNVFRTLATRMVRHPNNVSVLASVDGKPVGGAAFECAGELMCLFSGAVLPQWRRRGIQSAMIRWRLSEGRRLGATWATVHGAPGGGTERNVRRHGFELGYGKTVMALLGEGLSVSP